MANKPLNTNFGDTFPQRNLGSPAEGWGREIENRINQLERVSQRIDGSLSNTNRTASSMADALVMRDKRIEEEARTAQERNEEIREGLNFARERLSEVSEELGDMSEELDQRLEDLEGALDAAELELEELENVVLPDLNEKLKNRTRVYTGSSTPPVPTDGHNAGDIWFKKEADESTTTYVWDEGLGAWEIKPAGSQAIQDGAVIAGKIAAGSVGADEIIANSIGADEIVANSVAGAVGSFLTIKTDQITVTGSAGVNELVANEIWAEKIASKKVLANEVLVGGGANLIQDPSFELWYRDTTTVAVVKAPIQGPGGAPAVVAGASTGTAFGGYYAGSTNFTQDQELRIPVDGVEEFRASVYVYAQSPIPAGSIRLGQVRYTDSGSRSLSGVLFDEPVPSFTWTKVEVDWITISSTRFLGMYISVNSNYTGEVYFSLPSVIRKVGHNLIVDGGILARHLDVVSTDEANNRALSIQPDGLRLYGDVSMQEDPAIAITTTGAEYISITDGSDTVIGLDQSGTVTGQVLSAADRVEVAGENLVEMIEGTATGGVVWGEQNVRARSATTGAGSDNAGVIELMELSWDVVQGRTYLIDAQPLSVYISADSYVFYRMTHTWASEGSEPSSPTIDSPDLANGYLSVVRPRGTSTNGMWNLGGSSVYVAGHTGSVRVLFWLEGFAHTNASSAGSMLIFNNNMGGICRVNVFDMGRRDVSGNMSVNRTRIINGEGASPPPPPPPPAKKTYTKTYNSTGGASYKSSGGRITTAPYAGRVTQGGGALGPHGEIHGAWFFGNPWASDISGATIKKVELYITNQHSYYNAGLSARVHRHTNSNSSAPNTFTAGSLSNLKSFSFSKGQGKWVDVTSIFATTTRGFGLKYSGTAQYGYFSNSARVRITYEK